MKKEKEKQDMKVKQVYEICVTFMRMTPHQMFVSTCCVACLQSSGVFCTVLYIQHPTRSALPHPGGH